MDLRIKGDCGHRNCIGVDSSSNGQLERVIAIEGYWTAKQSDIENAMPSLISHETIEFLIRLTCPQEIFDIHDLIGKNQDVEDYMNNEDGIVFRKRGKVVENPWAHKPVLHKRGW
jgi:hypothetical protein